MEANPEREKMEDGTLNDEREHHWRKIFEDNQGGMDDDKRLIHSKRWDI